MKITIEIELDERELMEEEIEEYSYDGDDRMELSPYARIILRGENCWSPIFTREGILIYIMQTQNYANHKLKHDGYLYLNDVYKMLNIPEVEELKYIGWLYDEKNPIGDNYVDFGIYDHCMSFNRDPSWEHKLLLDFNVDGYIGKRK